MELVLLMYIAHPYFSLKNLGKKTVHYTWQNTVGPCGLKLYFQPDHPIY